MGLAEVKADTKVVRDQLLKLVGEQLTPEALKHELTENVLPLFEGLVDAVTEELTDIADEVADQGDALDTLIDASGDVLHPESAAKIVGLAEVGKALADELEKLLPKADDLQKKRLRQLVKSYRQGAEVVIAMVNEITLEDDDEDDEAVEAPPPAGELDPAANANDNQEQP